MEKFLPFFINSNLCTDLEDIMSYEQYSNVVNKNIGNSYPTWSLIKQLYGLYKKPMHIKNIFLYDFNQQEKDLEIINNKCTHVFFMLQDHIRTYYSRDLFPKFDLISQFINKINKPIIVLSLGCNQYYQFDSEHKRFIINNQLEKNFVKKLNIKLVHFLKTLADHSEVIGIRGAYTQEVLAKLGIFNTEIIGCPSYFENGPTRILLKKDFKDISKILISSPYNNFDSKSHFDFNDKYYKYAYLLQDEEYYQKMFWTTPNFLKDKNIFIFSDICSWKKFVSSFDLVYGYRIHSSILAINSGTPPLFVTPDLKGKEMSDYLSIPYNSDYINERNIKKIYDEISLDSLNANYPRLYKQYKSFLFKNHVEILDAFPLSVTDEYKEKQPRLSDKFLNRAFNFDLLEIYFIVTTNNINDILIRLYAIFDENSVVRNCKVTVLDSYTNGVLLQYINKYYLQQLNIKYIRLDKKNKLNLIETMKLITRKYVWFIYDKVSVNFRYWDNVTKAMENDYDAIIVSHIRNWKFNSVLLPNQMLYLSSTIYKTKIITNKLIDMSLKNLNFCFPHSILISELFNNKSKIFLIKNPLFYTDTKIILGTNLVSMDYIKILNSLKVYILINDNRLKTLALKHFYMGKPFSVSLLNLFWRNKLNVSNFLLILRFFTLKQKIIYSFVYIFSIILYPLYLFNIKYNKDFIEYLFSIKNSKDRKYKIFTFWGHSFMFKRFLEK